MSKVQRVDRLKHTKAPTRRISPRVRVVFAAAKIALSYLFISLAINSGSLWQYTVAFVLAVSGIADIITVFKHIRIAKK
jgi:hypothetical protein